MIEKTDSLGLFLAARREDLKGSPNQLSQQDISDATGFAQSYVSKLERGSLDGTVKKWRGDRVWALLKAYRFPDHEILEIAKRFNLDLPPRQPHLNSFQTDSVVSLGQTVKVYAAGTGPAWEDDDVLEVVAIPDDIYPGIPKVGLKAMGESMEPYLPKGAVAVIVLDDGMVNPGDYCGVWLHGDGVVIKRFVQEGQGGELLLESLNPDPGESRFFVAPLGSRVMGKVVTRVLYG